MIRRVVILLPLLVLVTSIPLHRTPRHHVHHHDHAKHQHHATRQRETGTKRQEGMEAWPKCCSLNAGNSHTGAHDCSSCKCEEGNTGDMDNNNAEGGGMEQESASKRQEGAEPWPKCCKVNGHSAGGEHGCPEKYGGAGSMGMESSDAESVDMGQEGASIHHEGEEPWPKCCKLNGHSTGGAQGCPESGAGIPMSMDNSDTASDGMEQESASKRQDGTEPWPKCCKVNGHSAGGAHGCPEKYDGGGTMGMESSDAEGVDIGQECGSMHHEGDEPWPKCCKLNGHRAGGAHGYSEKYGGESTVSMDNNNAESDDVEQESASKRQEGTEPWSKCCNLNAGNSLGAAHRCTENSGGMGNGYIKTDSTSTTCSDTVDICPPEMELEGKGEEEEESSKRNSIEPWPKCCRLNGGKSGGVKGCSCNDGGSFMGDKGSFMDDKNSYMNDKSDCMDDKSAYMNGKTSYIDDKNSYMDDKNSYMDNKNEYMNGKNSFMNDGEMNNKNSYMDDKNSYMNADKNSYMNEKNSYMGDRNSDMDEKGSIMDDKETGSFKGTLRNNSLVDPASKISYMKNSQPHAFKPHDYDTHTVTKACEGDYKECNQGWNACKTPCFGPHALGGNVYGGSTVRESDQNDMNTVKAIAAMDTAQTVDMLGKHNGLQVATSSSQEHEPTSAEIQENDTKIAKALSFNKLTGDPAEGKGLVQTGGQAAEPYKVKVSQGPVTQGPRVTI